MIVLHRLGHAREPFHLNPDHIVSVEATPDTVVVLVTGNRVLVAESPEAVADLVLAWRAAVLAAGLTQGGPAPRQSAKRALALVKGSPPPYLEDPR